MTETASPPPASSSRSRVRALYLYLLALVGILLLTIGSVRMLDMGLKALVFTSAEQEERIGFRQPPMPYALDRVERLGEGEARLSEQELVMVRGWLEDYRVWKEQSERVDPIRSRRERTAASSLAMILIGLPLYLFHWRLIRRETTEG